METKEEEARMRIHDDHFTPSPTKLVKFVNGRGEVIKEVRLNRKDRRRLKIGR